ncbi:MAG: hypothetical protein JW782_01590, partial [Candidatus Saganbacteria bacterium]|nr:hypothetical protein [Candidatus Saganbacteria bacterium]
TVPDNIYFDVVAVPWPSGGEKIPADHLPTSDNSISKIVGSIVTVDDSSDSGLDPCVDILNIRMEVQ